jgi:hypothetical protein
MLRAASDVYSEHYPNPALQTQFKTFAGQMKNIAGRRNDIAHGIVARWYLPGESFLSEVETWALFPSYIMTRHRQLNKAPDYAMGSSELEYFSEQFRLLLKPAYDITSDILSSKHPSQ